MTADKEETLLLSILPDPPVAVLVGAVGFVSAAEGVEVATEVKFQN